MSSTKRDDVLKWPAARVRQSFIDFFAERDHHVVPSSSLVPGDDPTLLFTNAGMVQFKDVFLGTGSRPYSRAVDSQKCMRVAGKHNDLDDVGRDGYHHTFFEMLGNWSFGDYYKEEAISWAWQLLTEIWDLPKEKIWATIFEDEQGEIPRDDEAEQLWRKQPGFNIEQILPFGRSENFWEMADTGPCGPDSEIHFDRGLGFCEKQGEAGHQCRVNGDCSRYLELWNLVFIQYNKTTPNNLEPLPNKHVDTGMGLDRLVSLLQDVESNYDTDLFTPVLDQVQRMVGHTDQEREAFFTPYRVIADHSRAAAFMIADGVVPGNTGRNYVCRMVIRRANRFGGQLGFDRPFMAETANSVIQEYGKAYPELERNKAAIMQTITDEEIRFQQTVDKGISQLENFFENTDQKVLSGKDAFNLYATYGLPLEITRDILREREFEVNEQEFLEALESHRFISGGGKEMGGLVEDVSIFAQLLDDLIRRNALGQEGVHYDPYSLNPVETELVAILKNGELVGGADPGDEVQVVLSETPFYVEAGGQVSDLGQIESGGDQNWTIVVVDTHRPVDGIIVHQGYVDAGTPKVGDRSRAIIDLERRWDIMRNHTATHLLHAALQHVLGEHARQAGSLVAPDRLRFDFNHSKALTAEEIEKIEAYVNEAILANYNLQIQFRPHAEALAEGAMALFGETYGDTVRTISIDGEQRISYELCGGTHVPQTGVIGPFLIESEGSVAAGVRRLEALTGREAIRKMQNQRRLLQRLSERMAAPQETLEDRYVATLDEFQKLAKDLDSLKYRFAELAFSQLESESLDDIILLRGTIPQASAETLRKLIDRFRQGTDSGIVVLASEEDGRALIVAAVSEDLVDRGLKASDIVKVVAEKVGGSGGGKPDLAQAGGPDAENIPEALGLIDGWIHSKLT
jgi:alanyl-tRNA synthetase